MNSYWPLIIILVFNSSAFASNNVRLCYEEGIVYPWTIEDGQGLAFTELGLVEKELNIKFSYVRLPWKRCQYEAQAGNVEGIFAASFAKERAQWGIYPTLKNGELDPEYRMHTDSFYVYVRKDSEISFKDNKFINLKNNPIGVQLGYSVGSDLKEMGHPIQSSFSNAIDLFKQLDIGDLNVAVLQNHEALRTLRANPRLSKSILRMKEPFKVKYQYLLMTKRFYSQNPLLVKNIWESIAKARKSSIYNQQANKLLLQN